MKLLRWPSRADVFSILLGWLIVLLVFGTLAQKELGLYVAQQRYFHSIFFLAGGWLPLPGGALTLAIITWGLGLKLALQKWTKKQTGTLIVHIGAFLLLLGGFITGFFSQEGNMVIPEGQVRAYFSDYHQVELAVLDVTDSENVKEISTVQEDVLLHLFDMPSAVVRITDDLVLSMRSFYRNCGVESYGVEGAIEGARGLISQLNIVRKPIEKESELNRSCLLYSIEGVTEEEGEYGILEDMPIPQIYDVGGRSYQVLLRRVQTQLPFTIYVKDFVREVHPGTGLARAYSTDLIVKDGDFSFPAKIRMNEPLRYRGYTFYQASFIQEGSAETTVLAVVQNAGRSFPYISSLIMCFGLLWHLFMRLPALLQRKGQK